MTNDIYSAQTIQCSNCEHSLSADGYMYVTDSYGKRICCPFPGEHFTVGAVLGVAPERILRASLPFSIEPKWWWSRRKRSELTKERQQRERLAALIKSRTGYVIPCYCEGCLTATEKDVEIDDDFCPECSEPGMRPVSSYLGQLCPVCFEGMFFKVVELPQHLKTNQDRELLLEEFCSAAAFLRKREKATQIAVGIAIDMANSMFTRSFSERTNFLRYTSADRTAYIGKLAALERDSLSSDPHLALGFGLFKMWVAAVSQEDIALENRFGADLAYFSMLANGAVRT